MRDFDDQNESFREFDVEERDTETLGRISKRLLEASEDLRKRSDELRSKMMRSQSE